MPQRNLQPHLASCLILTILVLNQAPSLASSEAQKIRFQSNFKNCKNFRKHTEINPDTKLREHFFSALCIEYSKEIISEKPVLFKINATNGHLIPQRQPNKGTLPITKDQFGFTSESLPAFFGFSSSLQFHDTL